MKVFVTEATMTREQKIIHDALPAEFRGSYLRGLPKITDPFSGKAKKVAVLAERVATLNAIQETIRQHVSTLETKLSELELGADPASIDLRKVLPVPEPALAEAGGVLRILRD